MDEGKELVKDGVWQVPEEERPVGWREMGLLELSGALVHVYVEKEALPPAKVHSEPGGGAMVVATNPTQLHSMQQTTLDWCRMKLGLLESEGRELVQARDQALKNKWNANALKRHVGRNVKRQDFYQRVIAAMEAGYCMFPTTEATVFAVRVESDGEATKGMRGTYRHHPGRMPVRQGKQRGIKKGAGYYVSSIINTEAVEVNEGTEEAPATRYRLLGQDPEAVEFPMVAAKIELMNATDAAMELKVFDEIGLLPGVLMANSHERQHAQQIRVADPVIVGRIVDPTSARWGVYRKVFTFMIGWFIHTKDL